MDSMNTHQSPKFRTDPVPYDVPPGDPGDGVRLGRDLDKATITIYERTFDDDSGNLTERAHDIQLTARQLRTLAVDAMSLAAEILSEGDPA